jgi:hypothetical protein
VPVAGPTIEKGVRYANHPIQCNISKFHTITEASEDMAWAATISVGSNLSRGLAVFSEKLETMSREVKRVADQMAASNGKQKAVPWFRGFATLLDQLKRAARIGGRKVKDKTEKMASEDTGVTNDHVDLFLKIRVDQNEEIQYIGVLDLVSANNWSVFWRNRDEPKEAEEQELAAEIKSRRKSR